MMAAVRLSWQFLIWIILVVMSVVVVDAEHNCIYNKMYCKRMSKILVLKANRADDWENCNRKRECDYKEQAGSFECKCELDRGSHMKICGHADMEILDSKEIFIHNEDYPKKNNQTDPCECVVKFKPSGGFPIVSLSHIDLPSGSDKSVYISDGSVTRYKSDCIDPINCELYLDSMSSKVGTLIVVSEKQSEPGRFWIRVSAQMGMNVTCQIKKIEPTKEYSTPSTLELSTTPIREKLDETIGNSFAESTVTAGPCVHVTASKPVIAGLAHIAAISAGTVAGINVVIFIVVVVVLLVLKKRKGVETTSRSSACVTVHDNRVFSDVDDEMAAQGGEVVYSEPVDDRDSQGTQQHLYVNTTRDTTHHGGLQPLYVNIGRETPQIVPSGGSPVSSNNLGNEYASRNKGCVQPPDNNTYAELGGGGIKG